MPRFTFSKDERLCSFREIDLLFAEGTSLNSFPIRLLWKEVFPGEEPAPPIRAMFAAPKRKFGKAVDRNRIKRLLREYYRLQKPEVYNKLGQQRYFHLAFIYTSKELPESTVIQKAMINALDRWLQKIITPGAVL